MRKLFIIVVTLFCTFSAQTQVRVGMAYGTGGPLKPKIEDTAFFGRKYNNFQLRLGIHKGRVGIIFTGGIINQKPGKIEPQSALVGLPAAGIGLTGGNVRNTFFTLGPEICFPLGKLRFSLHASGGMGWVKADETAISEVITNGYVYYQSGIENNTTGIVKTGIGIHYYFTEKMAFSLFTDYMGYSLKYINTDRRFGAGASKTITQSKSVLNLSGGLTYKF